MADEKHVSLCDICLWMDISVEIRGGTTLTYPSCDYFHQWFGKVKEPRQCRDFNPVAAVESD